MKTLKTKFKPWCFQHRFSFLIVISFFCWIQSQLSPANICKVIVHKPLNLHLSVCVCTKTRSLFCPSDTHFLLPCVCWGKALVTVGLTCGNVGLEKLFVASLWVMNRIGNLLSDLFMPRLPITKHLRHFESPFCSLCTVRVNSTHL